MRGPGPWRTKPRPGAQVDWGNPINDHLLSWWLFDEAAGQRVADLARFQDGTLSGGNADPARDWVGSPQGGTLDFDGDSSNGSYVDLGTMDAGGRNGLTIVAWFVADALSPSDYRIISKASGVNEADHYWMISGSGGATRFRLKAGAVTNTVVGSVSVSTGVWYCVAAQYDGVFMRIYMDGVEAGSLSKTGTVLNDSSVGVNIARNPDGYGEFNGRIENVRIWRRGLLGPELSRLVEQPFYGILARSPVRYFVPAAVPPGTRVQDVVGGFGLVPFAR